MAHLIKIDTNTLRRNPSAGSTFTRIPYPPLIRFSCEKLPDEMKGMDGVYINSWKEGEDGSMLHVDGTLHKQALEVLQPKMSQLGIEVTIINQDQVIEHAPNPDWLYERENPIVDCGYCQATFKVNDLQSREEWDGNDERWLTEICPNCGEPGCVDLEYETVKKALLRKGEPR